MFYFNSLPKIITSDQNGNPLILTNILTRAKLLEDLQNNPMLFYQYSIQDGDTPEIIADKYYGDPYRYWIVLYSNQILDPMWQWPLTQQQFDAYIDSKYATQADDADQTPFEYAQTNIYEYQKITSTKDLTTDTETIHYTPVTEEEYNSITPDSNTYTFEDGSSTKITIDKRVVTVYDHEYELNESRRQIKVMNELYVPSMESQFTKLMAA